MNLITRGRGWFIMANVEKHLRSLLRLHSRDGVGDAGSTVPLLIARDKNEASISAINGHESSTFSFDGFANMDVTPRVAYRENVKELVDSVLKGYNGTFVSLGLESTDHFTFALDSKSSILREAANHILKCIQTLKGKGMSSNLTVPCSYVMIANEKVYDLLQDFNNKESETIDGDLKPHTIKITDSRVRGCKTIEAKTVKDVCNMLDHGSKTKNMILLDFPDCRAYSCAFSIGIEYSKFGSMFAPISGTFMLSVLVVPDYIDLIALELKNVSLDMKSIAALASVIELAASSHDRLSNCCYEDSLLTRLLQATLGGNSKTILMTHMISSIPLNCLNQSRFLLQLGSKARLIENKPDKTELAEKALMDAYLKEMRRQSVWSNSNQNLNHKDLTQTGLSADDELMIAQALASAAKDQFEYDSEDSDEDSPATGGTCIVNTFIELLILMCILLVIYSPIGKRRSHKRSKIILKGKKLSQVSVKTNNSDHNSDEDVTVETIVALIQDPDTGVPRAAESALINVQIHRGQHTT